MKFLKNIKKLAVFFIALSNISCTSPINNNGKVEFELKNNTPCFYINDKNYQGEYEISITEHNTQGEYAYRSTFDKHYPNKNNCILFNNKTFSNLEKVKEYTNYSVKIFSGQQNWHKPAGNHGSNFCLIRENGQLTIIEPEYNCQLYKK